MSYPILVRLLAVSTAGVIVSQVGIVFYVYLLAWNRSPHRRGLIPLHVLGVSVFAVLTEVVFVGFTYDLLRREAPLSIYGPLMLLANLVLMVSLVFIFRFDQRRISAASLPREDHAEVPHRRAEDLAPPSNKWWGRRVRRL